MKVGLLVCDHIDESVKKHFGDYPEMFQDLFPEFEFKLFDCINGIFPDLSLNECDVFMATGSRYSVYEDIPWINKLKQTVQAIFEAKIVFIGYCFGHQLLAEALGGKVEKSNYGWCVGAFSFEINKVKEWMKPSMEKVELLVMCQDQVTILPENSEILASNTKCPVGMFQVSHHALGMQAHPEFTAAYDQYLIQKRRLKIGEAISDEGIMSLEKNIDQKLIREWIIQFIKQSHGK